MISFFVPGLPRPGGSKKAFRHAKTGKIMVVDACARNKEWRAVVALAARQAYNDEPLTGSLVLSINFYLPRPKGHYGSGKNSEVLKPSAPVYPIVPPDLTKLIRSTEDALTGILWADDAQVVIQYAKKYYGARIGAEIEVQKV